MPKMCSAHVDAVDLCHFNGARRLLERKRRESQMNKVRERERERQTVECEPTHASSFYILRISPLPLLLAQFSLKTKCCIIKIKIIIILKS